jgi:hypothetical protein
MREDQADMDGHVVMGTGGRPADRDTREAAEARRRLRLGQRRRHILAAAAQPNTDAAYEPAGKTQVGKPWGMAKGWGWW